MTKEQLLGAFEMRINGFSYAEIGEKYNLSKQRVEANLKGVIKQSKIIAKRELVADFLNENGMTITDLAKRCDCSRQTMNAYLKGKDVSTDLLSKIHEITGLSYDKLMEISDEEL